MYVTLNVFVDGLATQENMLRYSSKKTYSCETKNHTVPAYIDTNLSR